MSIVTGSIEELKYKALNRTEITIRSHAHIWYDDSFLSDIEIEPHSRLIFVEYGEMCYEIDGKVYTVKKNQLLLLPERRHVKRYVLKDKAAHVQMCRFNAEFGDETIFDYIEGIWHTDIPDPQLVDQLFERFHVVNEDNLILDCMEKKAACIKLLCLFMENADIRISRKHSEWDDIDFEEVAEYIKENINSRDKMTIEYLAKRSHVNYNHFISGFHAYFGISPMQYILNIRLDMAKSMLKNSDYKIREIAEDLQFESTNYFSSFFKKRTGMTPGEYRESQRCS